MPARCAVSFQFLISVAISLRNSSGVLPAAVVPCSASFAIRSGSRSALFTSVLIFATMSFGVPAVVRRPSHCSATNPGKPASSRSADRAASIAGGAAGRERPRGSGLKLRPDAERGEQHELHLAGGDRERRRRAAAIGDVLHFDAGPCGPHFQQQMRLGRRTGRAVVELARILLHQSTNSLSVCAGTLAFTANSSGFFTSTVTGSKSRSGSNAASR